MDTVPERPRGQSRALHSGWMVVRVGVSTPVQGSRESYHPREYSRRLSQCDCRECLRCAQTLRQRQLASTKRPRKTTNRPFFSGCFSTARSPLSDKVWQHTLQQSARAAQSCGHPRHILLRAAWQSIAECQPTPTMNGPAAQ